MYVKFINFWEKDNVFKLKTFCFVEFGLYETDKNWQFAFTLINFRISFVFDKKGV